MMRVRDCMGTEIEVRCPKCQEKVKVIATSYSRTANERVVLKGTHNVCGTVCIRLTANMED